MVCFLSLFNLTSKATQLELYLCSVLLIFSVKMNKTRLRFSSDSVGAELRYEANIQVLSESYKQVISLIGEDPSR